MRMTQQRLYRWAWNSLGEARKGATCIVVVRSSRLNSAWIEFTADGFGAVVSRNGLRRVR